MRPIPSIDIVALRRIADREWDALTAVGQTATGTDHYDRFLAAGAVMLWNGSNIAEVGDYFVGVEIDCLGLDTGEGIRERAQLFAKAILQYLNGLERKDCPPRDEETEDSRAQSCCSVD